MRTINSRMIRRDRREREALTARLARQVPHLERRLDAVERELRIRDTAAELGIDVDQVRAITERVGR